MTDDGQGAEIRRNVGLFLDALIVADMAHTHELGDHARNDAYSMVLAGISENGTIKVQVDPDTHEILGVDVTVLVAGIVSLQWALAHDLARAQSRSMEEVVADLRDRLA
jgi:hypothetical protein